MSAANIRKIIAGILQIGKSSTSPQVKENGTVLEVRDGSDAAYAELAVLSATDDQRAVNKGQLDVVDMPRVTASTTGPLAGTWNYANGTGGVGATLTRTTNGALPNQDNVALTTGQTLFVGYEAAGERNGPYYITQAGSGGAPTILTRLPGCDKLSNLAGCSIAVELGDTFGGAIWGLPLDVSSFIVGTTALPFQLRNSAFFGRFQVRTSFTQPAVGATVTVDVTSTLGWNNGQTVEIQAAGFYEVAGFGTGTLTLRNIGGDDAVAPASTVLVGSYGIRAPGALVRFTYGTAGAPTLVVPTGCSKIHRCLMRPGSAGGGGGGGGGGGNNNAANAGGGAGGSGGGSGGSATYEEAFDLPCVSGETLTITIGDGGAGGTAGTAGAIAGNGGTGGTGSPGNGSFLQGSSSGTILATTAPSSAVPPTGGIGGGGGGAGGAPTGGVHTAAGTSGTNWGTRARTQTQGAQDGGDGGTGTAGANGTSAPSISTQSGTLFDLNAMNGKANTLRGAGNGTTSGGGGAGGAGAGGNWGDEFPIGPLAAPAITASAFAAGGHGGNATTNASLAAGTTSPQATGGRGGAGGGGGGGGGGLLTTGLVGAAGATGTKGSAGLVVLEFQLP